MLASVPQDKLRSVIDESAAAFGGRGEDLARLLDSTTSFVDQMSAATTPATTLVQQLDPLLQTQVVTGDQIRQWASSVAQLSGQLEVADGSVRNILETGPGFATEADLLFQGLKPTLPVLLANFTSTASGGFDVQRRVGAGARHLAATGRGTGNRRTTRAGGRRRERQLPSPSAGPCGVLDRLPSCRSATGPDPDECAGHPG